MFIKCWILFCDSLADGRHTKNDTKSDFRVKQIMYSDQDGRGKKVIFVFKRQVGEYVSIVFVSVRVVQDDLHYLHSFCLYITCLIFLYKYIYFLPVVFKISRWVTYSFILYQMHYATCHSAF